MKTQTDKFILADSIFFAKFTLDDTVDFYLIKTYTIKCALFAPFCWYKNINFKIFGDNHVLREACIKSAIIEALNKRSMPWPTLCHHAQEYGTRHQKKLFVESWKI